MRFVRLSKRVVYENPWIRFEAHDIIHPSGASGEHGLVGTPRASAVVVFEDGAFVLTRQARFAIDRVVLEFVKGGAEPGESALDTAKREAREEIGIEAARWDSLGYVFELPSLVDNGISLFLAREITHVATALEHVESIDAVRLGVPQAVAAALDGTLEDAVTGVALLRAADLLARDAASAM